MLPKPVPLAISLMDLPREGKQNSHAPSTHCEYHALYRSSNEKRMSFHRHSQSTKETSNAHFTVVGRAEKEMERLIIGDEQEFNSASEGAGWLPWRLAEYIPLLFSVFSFKWWRLGLNGL